MGIAAARALVASRHEPSGAIPLGNEWGENPEPAFVEINIDGLAGTAALCGWAADEAGDSALRVGAIADARVHAELLIRPDGSTWQAASLDRATGRLLRRHTQKGVNDDSTWARGQAWAILGFTQAVYWLSAEFVEPALATADWWCDATNGRRVPPWDYADPDGPPDTSAAAIAALALLALADLPTPRARLYRQVAHETLDELVHEHLTPVARDDLRPEGMLLDGCYNRRARWADQHELIWGDWFLLEALLVAGKALPRPWWP